MRSLAVTGAAAVLGTIAIVAGATVPADALTTGSTASTRSTAAGIRSATSTALFAGGPYRSATSEAARAAAALRSTDPAGASAADAIARWPVATWLGDWTRGTTLTRILDQAVAGAEETGTTPVFVLYAIPHRDCGGYSAGGFDEATYDAWVDQVAARLAGHRAAVVVEPDALAMLSNAACDDALDEQRYRILSRTVATLTAAGVPSYLDGGNSNWVPAAVMAARLERAGVRQARGFSTNVANYYPTDAERAYAERVSAATGGSHYVIDTSRNGQGWRGTWCNAPGAGLGSTPRVVSDGSALDALLWVKTPGASDGTCNGGPSAGTWFPAYARTLVGQARLDAPRTAAPAYRHDPYVALEDATVSSGGVSVTGWAFDGDATTRSVSVAVTVDGRTARTLTASGARPDVGRTYGAGDAHGFRGVVPTRPGRHTVCAVARNVGPGTDRTATCRTVTVAAAAPTGRRETATSPSHRRVHVSGWAFDRDDTAKALAVRVAVDGRTVRTVTAGRTRTDVDRAHGVGAAHGFATTVVAGTGRRTVCVTAVGTGRGGDRSLGCTTVAVR